MSLKAYSSEIDIMRNDLLSSSHSKQIEALKHAVFLAQQSINLKSLYLPILKLSQDDNFALKKLAYQFLQEDTFSHDEDMTILLINGLIKDFDVNNQSIIKAMALRVVSRLNFSKYHDYLTDRILLRAINDPDAYVRKNCLLAILDLIKNSNENDDSLILHDDRLMSNIFQRLNDDNSSVFSSTILVLAWILNNDHHLYKIFKDKYPKFCVNFELIKKILIAINECSSWQKQPLLEFLVFYQIESHDEALHIIDKMMKVIEESESFLVTLAVKNLLMIMDQCMVLEKKNETNNDKILMNDKKFNYSQSYEAILQRCISSLITLLYCNTQHQTSTILDCLAIICSKNPIDCLRPFRDAFVLKSHDLTYVKIKKLELLVRLTDENDLKEVISEIEEYIYCERQNLIFILRLINNVAYLYERFPRYNCVFLNIFKKILQSTSNEQTMISKFEVIDILCILSDKNLEGIHNCIELFESFPLDNRALKKTISQNLYHKMLAKVARLCSRYPNKISNYEDAASTLTSIFPFITNLQDKMDILTFMIKIYMVNSKDAIVIDCLSRIFINIKEETLKVNHDNPSIICLSEFATFFWRFICFNDDEDVLEDLTKLAIQPKSNLNNVYIQDFSEIITKFDNVSYFDMGLVSGTLRQPQNTFVHPYFFKNETKNFLEQHNELRKKPDSYKKQNLDEKQLTDECNLIEL